MTNSAFETLATIITERRTQKVGLMNGLKIEKLLINQLLQLADWAPTHGHTEPWRFLVFEGPAFEKFCLDHAQMYWENTAPEKRNLTKFENIRDYAERASHLIITVMKRTLSSKIPPEEEYAATAASVQNLLLGAAALNIAAIWSTGGMAHSREMTDYLNLHTEDKVIAFLYLGYSDAFPKKGSRKIPLHEKVIWK